MGIHNELSEVSEGYGGRMGLEGLECVDHQ